jgi:hypothetical protein
MDPKKQEQILQHISETVNALNIFALGHYARLLQRVGVRKLTVYREFFLP